MTSRSRRRLGGFFAGIVLCGAVTAAATPVPAEEKAVLTVTVENVSPKGGNLRLALYDRKTYEADSDPILFKVVPVAASANVVTFDPVAPGVYAIKMFQDVDRNGKFETSWLGLPEEPYGFSSNAPADLLHLGPPTFDAAKITLKPGANSIEITLN